MKIPLRFASILLPRSGALAVMFTLASLAGCASPVKVDSNPPMRPGGPNWEEVDRTAQRVKEREQNKPRLVEVERSQEQGFRRMSDEDYAAELDRARAEAKKADPKRADAEIEKEAVRRADEARRGYERSVQSSASSTYEWKKP